MKWLLVVVVLGSQPVATNLAFENLDDCLKAEEGMRLEYANAFNKWNTWASKNEKASNLPQSREFMEKRLLAGYGVCIPTR